MALCPGQAHRNGVPLVAVFLPVIQVFEYLVLHPVGNALAKGARYRDQGNDPAGRFRCTAVVVRTLPEPALPAFKGSFFSLEVRKIHLVDKRPVAEYPGRILALFVQRLGQTNPCQEVRKKAREIMDLKEFWRLPDPRQYRSPGPDLSTLLLDLSCDLIRVIGPH